MIAPELEKRIRDGFDRWNRGDHSFDPEWTHPNVELRSEVAGVTGATYRGQEGIARFVADVSEAFDEWQLQVDELEEVGPSRVLGVGSVHLRGRGSGVAVDLPCAWILDHEDGVLTRFEPFLNRVEEARQAASR